MKTSLFKNVFSGKNAVRHFLNPDKNAPTPLVEVPAHLNPFSRNRVRIFIKMMNMLPLMNVKSLPAYLMLDQAYRTGRITSSTRLIENSSGNTVFSLAVLASLFGIRETNAIVSHEVSPDKLDLLRFFGTQITVNREPICPDPRDKTSGIWKAKKRGSHPGWFNPGQYENQANPNAHERWTGRQIWEQTNGEISLFVAGLGTTGTMTGAGRFLKKKNSHLHTLGVVRLPNNPVPGVRTPHLLSEIAFDWKSIVDDTEEIGTVASFESSLALCRAGLLVGPSSGFAFAGLLSFLEKQKDLDYLRNSHGEVFAVCVAPDSPLPYLNEYFENCKPSLFPKIKNESLLLHNKKSIPSNSREDSPEIFEVHPSDAFSMIYSDSSSSVWEKLSSGQSVRINKDVQLFDIRDRNEFIHFHLPGSRWISQAQAMKLKPRRQQKIFFICTMGRRTKELTRILRSKKINAFSIKGGVTEWSSLNLPRWRPEVCVVSHKRARS